MSRRSEWERRRGTSSRPGECDERKQAGRQRTKGVLNGNTYLEERSVGTRNEDMLLAHQNGRLREVSRDPRADGTGGKEKALRKKEKRKKLEE